MDVKRWEIGALVLFALGAVWIGLVLFEVVSLGGGATVYLETESVDPGSVPADAEVRSFETLSDPIREVVERSRNSTGGASVGNLSTDRIPEYVRYGNTTYVAHYSVADHGLDTTAVAGLFGAMLSCLVGAAGVAAALIRRMADRVR